MYYLEDPADRTSADLNLNEFDSFYEAFYTMIPSNNITEYNIGGRLMPRSLVETSQSTDELVDALKFIVNNGGVVSGSVLDVSDSPARGIFNSVNPVWRTAIFDAVIGLCVPSIPLVVLGKSQMTPLRSPLSAALQRLTSHPPQGLQFHRL